MPEKNGGEGITLRVPTQRRVGFKPGDELTWCYGVFSNWDLLRQHGFALVSNRYDTVRLYGQDLRIMPGDEEEEGGDVEAASRVKKMEKTGDEDDGSSSLTPSSSPPSFWSRLATAAAALQQQQHQAPPRGGPEDAARPGAGGVDKLLQRLAEGHASAECSLQAVVAEQQDLGGGGGREGVDHDDRRCCLPQRLAAVRSYWESQRRTWEALLARAKTELQQLLVPPTEKELGVRVCGDDDGNHVVP